MSGEVFDSIGGPVHGVDAGDVIIRHLLEVAMKNKDAFPLVHEPFSEESIEASVPDIETGP